MIQAGIFEQNTKLSLGILKGVHETMDCLERNRGAENEELLVGKVSWTRQWVEGRQLRAPTKARADVDVGKS